MIHVSQSCSPMRAILPLLERGDIVTHMYAPAAAGDASRFGMPEPAA
jgi:predicted amidohydrolase